MENIIQLAFLRKEFGLETARIILGHRSAAITEVYAELDHRYHALKYINLGYMRGAGSNLSPYRDRYTKK